MLKRNIFLLLLSLYCVYKVSGTFDVEISDWGTYIASGKKVILKGGNNELGFFATDNDLDTFVKYNGTDGWMVIDLGMEVLVLFVKVLKSSCCAGAMDLYKVGLHRTFDPNTFELNQKCGLQYQTLYSENFNTLNCKLPLQRVRYVSFHADVLAVAELDVAKPNKETFDLQYIGCLSLFGEEASVKVLTMAECVYSCLFERKEYAGVTKGGECLCSSEVGWRMLPSSQCNMPCSEDNYFCGGNNSFSVYRTLECSYTPCAVHCLNGGPIDVNGTCSDGCEVGWKGSACHIKEELNIPLLIGWILAAIFLIAFIIVLIPLVVKMRNKKAERPPNNTQFDTMADIGSTDYYEIPDSKSENDNYTELHA